MIKCNTLGMIEISKNDPRLTAEADVTLYDFLVKDGVTYLIANTLSGDDAYKDGVVIPKGEYLKGFMVDAWENQALIIDAKHIAFGAGETYKDDIAAGKLLTIVTAGDATGKLAIAAQAPVDAGTVYFKVLEKCALTGDAVKAKVLVVPTAAGGADSGAES